MTHNPEVEGSNPSPATNPEGVRSIEWAPFRLLELMFSDQRFPTGVSKEDELVHDEDEATPDQGSSCGPPDQPVEAR